MGDYGTHPTRYENLSDDDLYAMYRSSVYSRLDDAGKLSLLQETVNRDAMECGELGAPKVEFGMLSAGVSGEASDGVIRIDYNMAVKGIQSMEYEGRTVTFARDDYNIQALNTALHENVHCFQEQIIDGTIVIPDNGLTAEYQANSFTESVVLKDGSYRMGSQYLTGETPNGYCMYYFQATERDAYRSAELKTNNILQGLAEKFGKEPSFEAYAKDLEVNGYQAMEQKALELFNNPNFEANVNQTLKNHYFGTNVPVNREIEAAVKNEMEASYQKLRSQYEKQNEAGKENEEREEKNMGFDPKPVSLEEYNQSLRETVNGYYIHAKNDPSMNQEDVIRSTGEMAEKYLEAVEEFEAAQNMQQGIEGVTNNGAGDGSAVSGTAQAAEEGVGSGSGMDGGGAEDGLDGDGEGCDDGMDP